MSEQKHTAEPWYAVDYAGFHCLQSTPNYTESGDLFREDHVTNAAENVERAAVCVTAFAGIENPAAFMEAIGTLIVKQNEALALYGKMYEQQRNIDNLVREREQAKNNYEFVRAESISPKIIEATGELCGLDNELYDLFQTMSTPVDVVGFIEAAKGAAK